ncbi:hypothetical protein Pelo_19078 [Pelomyxa schiedti]|nr:hypothetical protein Pelo_19078 [Pelomyxa schiedti]
MIFGDLMWCVEIETHCTWRASSNAVHGSAKLIKEYKAAFVCSACRNRWTSAEAHIFIFMKRRANLFYLMPCRQRCLNCMRVNTQNWEFPQPYKLEIERLKYLITSILSSAPPTRNIDQMQSHMSSSHKCSDCEYCREKR